MLKILETKLDLNFRDVHGDTPLIKAVFQQDTVGIMWLLSRDNNYREYKNNAGRTALDIAQEQIKPRSLYRLLSTITKRCLAALSASVSDTGVAHITRTEKSNFYNIPALLHWYPSLAHKLKEALETNNIRLIYLILKIAPTMAIARLNNKGQNPLLITIASLRDAHYIDDQECAKQIIKLLLAHYPEVLCVKDDAMVDALEFSIANCQYALDFLLEVLYAINQNVIQTIDCNPTRATVSAGAIKSSCS